MEQTLRIELHGPLRELYPDGFTITASNVIEAVNGFAKQTGIFDVPLGTEKHCVAVVGFDTKESLYAPLPANTNVLHLVPPMIGGKGGFFKVIVGIVMIAATIMSAGTLAAAMAGTYGIFFNIGVSLVLGGLLEMLSPAPKMDLTGNSASDPEASKYLGASQNTVKIGTRIPLLYGEHIAYGHYLSFDVDSKDVAV